MSDNSTTFSREFVLNASDMNATPIDLHTSPCNSSDSTVAFDEICVTLRVEMFNVTSASVVSCCATFDPAPSAPAPLTVEECRNDPVGEHKSQLFAFHPDSRIVRPMWFETLDDEKDPEGNGCNDNAPNGNVTEVGSSQTDSSTSADQDLPRNFAVPSNSSDGSISGAQNVVLVFVASDPEIEDVPADASETLSPVLATTTGAEAGNTVTTTEASSTTTMASATPGSLVSVARMAQATSSMSSVSVSPAVSSGAPTSVPSPVPESNSATPIELGVQVVPESANNAISTSATTIMTPVNTEPYQWMFTPDS